MQFNSIFLAIYSTSNNVDGFFPKTNYVKQNVNSSTSAQRERGTVPCTTHVENFFKIVEKNQIKNQIVPFSRTVVQNVCVRSTKYGKTSDPKSFHLQLCLGTCFFFTFHYSNSAFQYYTQ